MFFPNRNHKFNIFLGTDIDMEHDITLVNSGTVIVPNFAVIESHLPSVLYANGKENVTFVLETKGWYNGSVVNFEISCSPDPGACGNDITLRNTVKKS